MVRGERLSVDAEYMGWGVRIDRLNVETESAWNGVKVDRLTLGGGFRSRKGD